MSCSKRNIVQKQIVVKAYISHKLFLSFLYEHWAIWLENLHALDCIAFIGHKRYIMTGYCGMICGFSNNNMMWAMTFRQHKQKFQDVEHCGNLARVHEELHKIKTLIGRVLFICLMLCFKAHKKGIIMYEAFLKAQE